MSAKRKFDLLSSTAEDTDISSTPASPRIVRLRCLKICETIGNTYEKLVLTKEGCSWRRCQPKMSAKLWVRIHPSKQT